jgi:hypothetical protein
MFIKKLIVSSQECIKMTTLKEIISKYAENYQTNKAILPEADLLEDELYFIAGIEIGEPASVLLIPVDSADLQNIGSACGSVGNKVFSNKSIVDFLKNRGVKEFLGIISDTDSEDTYKNDVIALNAIALPITGKDGRIFESLASKSNGSFRYECSKAPNWSIYESE